MSHNKLNELVNSLAKGVEGEKKVLLPLFTAKLAKVVEANPHDPTIIGMHRILSKMASNNTLTITRSELRGLYGKLYTYNNKFASYFPEEMGEGTELATPKFAAAHEKPLTGLYDNFSDPILVNALNLAFDSTATVKAASDFNKNAAKTIVASSLDGWNLKASKVEVEAGNEHFVVVTASYNTPKGITSVFVPVELKGKAQEPGLFMCNAGPQELNHNNLKNYLTKNAGAKLKVRASDVLDALTKQLLGAEVISDVKLAMTKMASKKSSMQSDGIIGQHLNPEYKKEVFIPTSKQTEKFADKLANTLGVTGFKFGQDKLNLGRDAIARTLAGFGMKNPQINVVASDDTNIYYGVSLFGGKVAFKVPVKVENNRINTPAVLMCNGSVAALNKENISNLLVSGYSDYKVAAATSAQHDLNPSDLVQNVMSAMADNNYAKAEDALNVLQQSGNVSAYKEAFAAYIDGLSAKKTASAGKSGCSMVIKNAHSSHALCGHTNLPLHKVYQDDHGNCRPNYRKGMDETYEGASFMNAKILG